jgi:hypothetical protein
MEIGTSLEGAYNACPPPNMSGWGGFKKMKRGIKKVGKKGAKVAKKTGKVAVKVHTAPIKIARKAGKIAMKRVAKLAARPIVKVVNKLAGRRAKYVAFQRSGSTVTTLTDRKKGGQYALSKIQKAGPVGKLAVRILRYTGGVTAGIDGDVLGTDVSINASGWDRDLASIGMSGAEIAAAAMAIVRSVNKITSALNRPGEAPSDPTAATTTEDAATETQPVVESAEENSSENVDTTEGDDRDIIAGKIRRKLRQRRIGRVLRLAINKKNPKSPRF